LQEQHVWKVDSADKEREKKDEMKHHAAAKKFSANTEDWRH
jgi:hypothetical protein